MSDVVRLLQQLIRIPSLNPMGREVAVDDSRWLEHGLTDFLEDWARRHDLPSRRQMVHDGRQNLLLRLDGQAPGCLLWEAHQDTVPADQMTIDPFAAQRRDGRIYGRGASDVKGGLASMLTALGQLRRTAAAQRPTVVMACTVDEEDGGAGAAQLHHMWQGPDAWMPAPTAAVVAEPTLLDVVVAHKGVVRWKCVALGTAAHSSQPDLGDSAIYRMASVVKALQRYHCEILVQRPAHPLLGRPTLSVGKIDGGASVNVVPDRCVIEIDRRLLPHEEPLAVWREVQLALSQAGLEEHLEHQPPFTVSDGLPDGDNRAVADRLSAAIAASGGPGRQIGVPFGTNASRLAPHVPAVVCGPGSIEQAHTEDEWVEVEQLELAVKALVRFAVDFG